MHPRACQRSLSRLSGSSVQRSFRRMKRFSHGSAPRSDSGFIPIIIIFSSILNSWHGKARSKRKGESQIAWTTLAPADRIGISSTFRFVRKEVLTKASLIKAFNKLSRCLKGKTEGTILFHPMTRGIAELEDPSLLKREYRGEGNPTFEHSPSDLLLW